MRKIALVTDSTSSLNDIAFDYDIRIVPLGVVFSDDESYIDGITITANEFYQKLLDNPHLIPRTSQVTYGQAHEIYTNLIEEGFTDILVCTISKELSGTYQSFLSAANELNDQVNIFLYDTKSASVGEGYIVLKAAEMIKEGKTPTEIIQALDELRDRSQIYLVVDSLKYLVKNGRLSGASGFLGSMLKVKPLLEVSQAGKVETVEKIRTKGKALARLIEKFKEDTAEKIPEVVYILHSLAEDTANMVKEEILKLFPKIKNIPFVPVSPVIGAHIGLGAVGLVFVK